MCLFILFIYHLFATCVALGQVKLLSTGRSHRRRLTDLFGELKLELHQFQQYFTPLISLHPWNYGKSKTTLGPHSSQAHPSYA